MIRIQPITSKTGLALVCLMLCACDNTTAVERPPTPDPTRIETRAQGLDLSAGERAMLHAADNAVVYGRLVRPVEYADADRTILLEGGLEQFGLERGTAVLDLQLVPSGVLVLHADHKLVVHTVDGDQQLDAGVEAPLSIAAGHVVYVAGSAPLLQLRRVSLDGGDPESLAPEILTAWSPVLSADGREVIFSASVDGWSALMRRDAGGELHRLDGRRVPSASVAPQWRDRHLIFQDEHGVAVHDLEQGAIVADYPHAVLLPDNRGDATWLSFEGSNERVMVEVPR